MSRQLRAHVALLCEQLTDGRKFLTGDYPGLVDANAYYNLWFIKSAYPRALSIFEGLQHVFEWMDRIQAIGHGERISVSRETAIQVARDAEPQGASSPTTAEELLGLQVSVAADDYGRDPLEGKLVGASEHQISILRQDPELGTIVVHFPRIGFSIQAGTR